MDGLYWKTQLKYIKMDDLGIPLFLETPIYVQYICLVIHIRVLFCIHGWQCRVSIDFFALFCESHLPEPHQMTS